MIQRGQIYWCSLDPIVGHEQGATRPVVIVSSDPYNGTQSPLVAIVPLTKEPIKTPLHLRLSKAETGLDLDSTALPDQARFVDRRRLRGVAIGRLEQSAIGMLDRALGRVLGLS